jgi:hypothetical protein
MVEPLSIEIFPFGASVLRRPPSASTKTRVFVLGAYPSALHVGWRPPEGKPIRAMAVDNEPEPFWNGEDENKYIERWKKAVEFRDGEWGEVAGVGALNGFSGGWVDENVLVPLGAGRDEACITDCIDTYFVSKEGARRIADTYVPFAKLKGLQVPHLAPHPSEGAIVKEGVRHHRVRLLRELAAAAPDVVVTLGNAALRVLRAVTGANDTPSKLRADSQYGAKLELVVDGRRVEWLPLAHPAAPRVYQDAHARWRRTSRG